MDGEVAETANNAVPTWVHLAREIRGVLPGFGFSVLRREASENLGFLKASGKQHHLIGIFSLVSYEVACFLCVQFTPVPISLNPARAGDPPLSTPSNHDRALDTELGPTGLQEQRRHDRSGEGQGHSGYQRLHASLTRSIGKYFKKHFP